MPFRLPPLLDPFNQLLLYWPSPNKLSYKGLILDVSLIFLQFIVWNDKSRFLGCPRQAFASQTRLPFSSQDQRSFSATSNAVGFSVLAQFSCRDMPVEGDLLPSRATHGCCQRFRHDLMLQSLHRLVCLQVCQTRSIETLVSHAAIAHAPPFIIIITIKIPLSTYILVLYYSIYYY